MGRRSENLEFFLNRFSRDLTRLGGMGVFWFLITIFYALGHQSLAFDMLIAIVLGTAVTIIFRLCWPKERPKQKKQPGLFAKIQAQSFPSMHSLRMGLYLSLIQAYFGFGLLFAIFFVTTIGVLYTRYSRKRHFPVDILGGFLLGLAIGVVVLFW